MDDRTAAREHDADYRFAPRVIESFIGNSLAAVGLPGTDAAKVAELMTEADLTGADAHGIFRLPQYVRRIRAGGFNTRPDITVTKTAAATAVVDGDNGMGHLVMSRAADTAIALARDAGVAWVGVRGSNHAGTAGLYAAMPVPYGMIGLYSAVANANHMAVWGGTELLLGTNPLGIAVPSGDGRGGARHGDHHRLLRDGQEICARRPRHAGGMADRPRQRRPAHRSAAQRAGAAAPDRRLQGQRPRHHARPARRRAQRRGVRPRRRRLQRRPVQRDQYRPFHGGDRHQALHAARDLRGRDRPPPARPARVAALPGTTRSACPATAGANAGSSDSATASHCPPRCSPSSTGLPATSRSSRCGFARDRRLHLATGQRTRSGGMAGQKRFRRGEPGE